MRWSGSKDYGYMKFRIDTIPDGNYEKYEAWVYSCTGHNNDGYRFVRRRGNKNTGYKHQHYAITDTTYTGEIYIPSYICVDEKNKIPVVGIEDNAFAKLQLIGNITIESCSLKHIGFNAFEVMASDSLYEQVIINTYQDLTIKQRAFKNSLFTVDEFMSNPYLTRDDCNILETRNCLKEVNIESSNDITIQKDAFIFCEGLEKGGIISSGGFISIWKNAFACKGVDEDVLNKKDDYIGTSNIICQPLNRKWNRNTELDYINIQGKVTKIDSMAFAGHVNIKRVNIQSPGTDFSLTIGKQAFEDLFHGSDDKFFAANK